MSDIGLIVVDPGHFHAALVQKESIQTSPPRCTSMRQSSRTSSITWRGLPASTPARSSRRT